MYINNSLNIILLCLFYTVTFYAAIGVIFSVNVSFILFALLMITMSVVNS